MKAVHGKMVVQTGQAWEIKTIENHNCTYIPAPFIQTLIGQEVQSYA